MVAELTERSLSHLCRGAFNPRLNVRNEVCSVLPPTSRPNRNPSTHEGSSDGLGTDVELVGNTGQRIALAVSLDCHTKAISSDVSVLAVYSCSVEDETDGPSVDLEDS